MAVSRGSKIFAVVMVAVVAAFIWGLVSGLERLADVALPEPVEAGVPVEFVISPGQSGQSIATSLDDQGVVAASDFLAEDTTRGLATSLAPGSYDLETGMDVGAVVDVIEAGPQVLRVTIPEGLRVDQTVVRLAEQTNWEAADFTDALDLFRFDPEGSNLSLPDWVPLDELPDNNEAFEGLLWPATYDFELDATPVQILQRLIDQSGEVMAQVPEPEVAAAAEAGVSRYDALIIASLIEREARVPEDRPLIAAVIRNRMLDGMRLQIDAASEYAVATEGAAEGSAYNLYEVDGLPPTPISGTRPQALQVAFTPPADVTSRFYVLSDACDGSHVFADTFDEHQVNVAAYRAVGGCE